MSPVGGRVATVQGWKRLEVELEGPTEWLHRFCGLEDLIWLQPKLHAWPKSWPKLSSLSLGFFEDGDLRMLKHLTGLASLVLWGDGADVTDVGLKELKHLPNLTSLSLPGTRVQKCHGRGA